MPEMVGAYLYADYVCGRLFRLTPNGSGWTSSTFGDPNSVPEAATSATTTARYLHTDDQAAYRVAAKIG
jgi:hypothetical protein